MQSLPPHYILLLAVHLEHAASSADPGILELGDFPRADAERLKLVYSRPAESSRAMVVNETSSWWCELHRELPSKHAAYQGVGTSRDDILAVGSAGVG